MLAPLALLVLSSPTPIAETLTLGATRDATLYEDPTGQTANGAGRYMFTGKNAAGERRRSLVTFQLLDVVPSHSTITSARLRLHVSAVAGGSHFVAVHRVTERWWTSSSNPPRGEETGVQAMVPDATWIHGYYTNGLWITPGGDYLTQAQDGITVGAVGFHEFDVTEDVQFMLDEYPQNNGWILVQDELGADAVVRYDTRESPELSARPQLVVEYELPVCGTNYCMSSHNSTGTFSRMDFEGSCMVSSNDLTLVCHSVPNDWGIFFYSAGQGSPGVPFGNGFLCVGDGSAPLVRFPPTLAQGYEMRYRVDLQALPTHGPIVAGDTLYFQLWYRDPAGAGSYFNMSDAIWIRFQ